MPMAAVELVRVVLGGRYGAQPETQEIFQKWDVHGTGVITRKRLQELLTQVAGKTVTDDEIERCISEAGSHRRCEGCGEM